MIDSWNNAALVLDDGSKVEIERRGDWIYLLADDKPNRRVHLKEFMFWLVKRQDSRRPDPLNANMIYNGIALARTRSWMWMGIFLACIINMFIILFISNLD